MLLFYVCVVCSQVCVCVHANVCAYAHMCACGDQRRIQASFLLYHFMLYSLETRSLSEPKAILVASKTQQSSFRSLSWC